jgi:protein-disulfide isomerase
MPRPRRPTRRPAEHTIDRVTDPAVPPEKPAPLSGVLLAATVLALVIAVATWFVSHRDIDQMRTELADLQAAHRELAQQVTGGRKGGGGPVGQTIDISGAPAVGNANAKVALVEFSDYECPFCIRHFQQTMPRVDANYVKTDKVLYVFRDFPIDQLHPQAVKAHEAGRCAQEQNKFWEMHMKLFSAPGTHTPVALDDLARNAGLNEAAFRACVASGRTIKGIRDTGAVVDALGATGTPWFFVGLREGTDKVRILKPIGGAQPYEQFALALDAALRESATR